MTEDGARDDIDTRRLGSLVWRSLRLLREVRLDLAVFLLSSAALALLVLPFAVLLFDVLWTRVLSGEPLTPIEARVLGFDPAVAVEVDVLADADRRAAARRALALGAGVALLAAPLSVALWYYQVWILQRINQILRVEFFERIQSLSLRFHHENRVGDAIYRIYQDSAAITQLVQVALLRPLWMTGQFLASLVIVLAFDPVLSLWLLAGVPPMLLVGWRAARPLRHGFRAAREANSRLTSRIQETVTGIRVIKAYGFEEREQERFERDSRRAFDAAFDARARFARYGVVLFWIAGAVLVVGTAWAALLTREETALFARRLSTAAGLAAWNLGLFNFFKDRLGTGVGSFRQLLRTWGVLQDIAVGLDRVHEVLDLEPDVRDADDAIPVPPLHSGVRFRSVDFSYDGETPCLEGIDLEAPRGSLTAIVGPTGSGKTTLVSLLLRLFDPDAGSIEIDGCDLRRFELASLRRNVTVALQENLLFASTIRENIRYAVPDASDAAVAAAARIACADSFIEELPEGYDTLLGERGAKLSTGQRQRISIARAVLKDTPILVLDEPTAALDAETVSELLLRLRAWGRDRVVLLVTHRLGTIRRADQIVVLERGRVRELGSHDALLARPAGAYRAQIESENGTSPLGAAGAGGLR